MHLNSAATHIRAFTRAALPAISRFHPDVIVATNGAPQVSILHRAFPTTKIVVFGRAGIGHDDLANLKSEPDLFIALTHAAEAWAHSHATPKTKVVYIPNPIIHVRARRGSLARLSLPHPIVLTVGALSRYKNIVQVIRAVSPLQASLLLIGDGEESSHISQELSQFPGDFRWLKHVDPAELPGYYAASDIFCFVPDPQESFGRVYLEAMAAGLPIVASDDPLRREIIGEQGIFVDPHDLSQLRAGLSSAHELGRQDYSKQLKPYQLKTVIKQIERAFYDLI